MYVALHIFASKAKSMAFGALSAGTSKSMDYLRVNQNQGFFSHLSIKISGLNLQVLNLILVNPDRESKVALEGRG